MNTTRIVQAANEIDKNERALKWLEEYGRHISARDRDSFTVDLRLRSASACPGAKEAEAVLSSLARFGIAELIETAKTNCRNTIEISRDTIAREVAALSEPCLEARLFVTTESLDAFMEANQLPPEPTPAPDVPWLVNEDVLANAADNLEAAGFYTSANRVREAWDRIEALQAEVARRDCETAAKDLRIAELERGAYQGAYHAGYHAQIVDTDREGVIGDAEARATAAEAERDALRAEVEAVSGAIGSVRFMDPPDGGDVPIAEQVARMSAALTAAEAKRDELRVEVERKDKALREAGEAIAEYFRYLHGGETRGSYDGKPEREGLRKAGYAVSRALADKGEVE